MVSILLFLWGGLVVVGWSMLNLDKIRLSIHAPYALGMAFVSNASVYGVLEVIGGWRPDTTSSAIVCAMAFSILADRRRIRQPWPRTPPEEQPLNNLEE